MGDRQVFIGNLCNVSNKALRAYCENYGPLSELSINREKENNVYHCFAFITFQLTRHNSQFMSNRPHFINGEEVFVKRALPRSTSTIPERLVVTNRLILQDLHQHDKRALRTYFQKFGSIKKIDLEHGYIDYEDYDDVDRILLARPHYIRDKEIFVTKFIPSDQHNHVDHQYQRSSHHHRSHTSHNYRHSKKVEQPDRIITPSAETITVPNIRKHEQNSSNRILIDQERDDGDENHDNNDEESEESNENETECDSSNIRYEYLQERFEEYKQSKEIEICALKMDLERTRRQLADLTQEKLDLLIKNQQSYHSDLILRLFPQNTSIHTQTVEDFFESTPESIAKKRKLVSYSLDREYEYYS